MYAPGRRARTKCGTMRGRKRTNEGCPEVNSFAGELDELQERLGGPLAAIALRERPAAVAGDVDSAGLIAAFGQLLDVMQRLEAGRPSAAAAADVTELGGYAFSLMERARRLLTPAAPAEAVELARATAAFTAWIVRRGGRIGDLGPVVDSLALLANRSPEPDELADLATLMLDTIVAAAPMHAQDPDSGILGWPGRPWRLLHLNAGIAATRSRRPELMERAFALLEAHLPQDAAQFFQQGMRQLSLADYPESVRSVMKKYFDQWNTAPAIH